MNLLETTVKGYLGREEEGGKKPGDNSEVRGGEGKGSLGGDNLCMWLNRGLAEVSFSFKLSNSEMS